MKKALTKPALSHPVASSLLYLEWLDAGAITQGDWLTRDEVMENALPGRFMNSTVGFLVTEDSESLVLAAQIAVDHEKPSYDLVMFIPKSLVRKRKEIKI